MERSHPHFDADLSMTQGEIDLLVKGYIGTSGGYLEGFSYRIHDTFYERYCDLKIDVPSYRQKGLTTLNAFVEILRQATPAHQGRIIRGVLDMLPPTDHVADEVAKRRSHLHEKLLAVAGRLSQVDKLENRTARRYYSTRIAPQKLSLSEVYAKLQHLYLLFRDRDYFKQKTGITKHEIPDSVKHEAELALSFSLFPITRWTVEDVTEEHVFDALEFLWEHVSSPGEWVAMTSESGFSYHDYSNYDQIGGREEFRLKANVFLLNYKEGYELTKDGVIMAVGTHGLQHILGADIIPYDKRNVDDKVRSAIWKWRDRQQSISGKKEAIRELADVFEWLKKTKKLDKVLDRKDEAAIFDIANNFAIRHHNPKQKSNYDESIWYSWIFHFYLATYHAVIRLLIKQEKASTRTG